MTATASNSQPAKGALAASRRRQRGGKATAAKKTLVIIGNGMASHKLCERLCSLGGIDRFRIVVFGEERQPAYDRVHLTSFLNQTPPEQLLLAPESWYAESDIELHLGDPVASVDRERKVVRSAGGKEISYDHLVFATGSRAFVPLLPGRELPGVFVYRTLEDLKNIREYVPRCKRAAVLGGGLLGVEAAKALHDLGLETWIVERGSSLLARQLDPQAGALLQSHVEKLGVRVCSQRQTQNIEALGDDRLLQFNTGECLRVQLVVMAVGIRPRDELAAVCGLELGSRGGIQINDTLQTSDPNIYAIGECVCHRGVNYGLAAPGYQMADLLAENLSGKRRKYTGSDQSTRLKLTGIEVSTLGDFQANGDDTIGWKGEQGSRRLILENGRLVGATAIGDWPEAVRIQELAERKARIWRWQRSRFARTGKLWNATTSPHVSQWSAQAIVCNCAGVRRGALSTACAEGCATVEQLARRTGASTVCGSCKPLLAQLVGAPAWLGNVPGLKSLSIACAVALMLALAIFLLPPITFADSVQSRLHKFDVLWRDGFWKQVSGFTLIGLTLISLGLSLRKRIKRFTLGEFGHWRAVHAVLGTVSLIALVTHTGFRLGNNFNLVLMLNFVALALVGALAGMVTALERRLNPVAAKRLRSFWTGTHIAIAWPLPVLVGLHVVIAYYF
jgi:nitrite reductase (NADH) large subunit